MIKEISSSHERRKIVFLDIDGVINTYIISNKPFKDGIGTIDRGGYYVDMCCPEQKRVSNLHAVQLLNLLCKEIDADIVISSTWRLGTSLEELKEILYNSGLNKDISIIGMTPWLPGSNRGKEIQKWLEDFSENIYYNNIIILDDDVDMDDFIERLILCHTYDGFTWSKYCEAKKLFEKE